MKETNELWGFKRDMLLQCLILYAIMWAGLLISNYLFLAALLYTLVTAVISGVEDTYAHLLFSLPFTVIYKLSPASTSLFAYLMIGVGLILILRKHRYVSACVVTVILFSAYAILGMGGNYTTVLKMIAGLLLFYVFVTSIAPKDFKNQIMAFALGTLGSSFIGLMKLSLPKLTAYFSDIDYIYVNGENTFRFSGLNYDPNYYSIGAIIAVFLCLRLFFESKGNRALSLGIALALTVFGLITYSKMFLISIAILIIFFVVYRMKSVRSVLLTLLTSAAILVLFYKWAQSSGYLDTILRRFSGGDISTGRFDTWKLYFGYIFGSAKTLLFGDGLGAPYYLGSGPHNAYIELIFFLGIAGGALFISAVVCIMGAVSYVKNRKLIDVALFIIFFFMIGTLGMVTVNDLMFYFMLLWISINFRKENDCG